MRAQGSNGSKTATATKVSLRITFPVAWAFTNGKLAKLIEALLCRAKSKGKVCGVACSKTRIQANGQIISRTGVASTCIATAIGMKACLGIVCEKAKASCNTRTATLIAGLSSKDSRTGSAYSSGTTGPGMKAPLLTAKSKERAGGSKTLLRRKATAMKGGGSMISNKAMASSSGKVATATQASSRGTEDMVSVSFDGLTELCTVVSGTTVNSMGSGKC